MIQHILLVGIGQMMLGQICKHCVFIQKGDSAALRVKQVFFFGIALSVADKNRRFGYQRQVKGFQMSILRHRGTPRKSGLE